MSGEYRSILILKFDVTFREEIFSFNAFEDPLDDRLIVEGPFHRVVSICNIERRLRGDIPVEKEMSHIKLDSFTRSSMTDDSEIQICSARSGKSDLSNKIPPSDPIIRRSLQLKDIVVACSNTKDICSPWRKAKIEMIQDPFYKVKFLKDDHLPTSFLEEKHIAYSQKSDVLLPRKSRVVAPISEEPETDEFYPGFIAEKPTPANNYRYLVFFDNGCACYIAIDNVYLAYWNGVDILTLAPQKMADFLRQYFNDFPARKMVKFQVGDKIIVSLGSEWVKGYVEKIDCNTVQIFFKGPGVKQWLYRGSPRLYLLSQQASLQTSQAKGRSRAIRKITDQRDVRFGKMSRPFVHHTSTEEDEENDIFLLRSERKLKERDPLLEQPSRAVQVPRIPVRKFRPKLFNPHRSCHPLCLSSVDEKLIETRDVNPFQLPILYGWERATGKVCGKFERVFYTAPCGRRLRSIEEVYFYLTAVRSELSIDLFSFSTKLKLFTPRNFQLFPKMSFQFTQDIARGTERHSISCINFKNHTPMPPEFRYCSKRFPSPNVNLDLDPSFLTCCDCEDNCTDIERCSCQQRTLKTFADHFPDHSISVYDCRRLHKSIMTGIWECNSKCSCNDKCQNRVVQNGMIAQLQIFYTGPEKGWGIRALHDIPRGTFLCVYAAQILDGGQDSDQSDEYFADLDYLECVEGLQKQKEGFEEAPVETISSDESENDSSESSCEASDSEKNYKRSRKEDSRRNDFNLSNRYHSERPRQFKSIREFHGETEAYILDAKFKGNIGRFINHSCGPNCFVQNVFIDSHDLRFPWVAFFAGNLIRAYEELTWDYGYIVGSIPGRKVKCHCGSKICRGRLL